jgi:glutaredoxin-related protein
MYIWLLVFLKNIQNFNCCGVSKNILEILGADYQENYIAKWDSILIDRIAGQYLLVEWKKISFFSKVTIAQQI